ncbi:hypothetical protein PMAYCL1PPCAC_10885, partial [Pristionchus mayeri]
ALRDWLRKWWHSMEKRPLVEIFALEDYTATRNRWRIMSFRRGDRFFLKSDTDKNWWFVKHAVTRRTGFVAKTKVARVRDEPHLEWISIESNTESATRLLSSDQFSEGSFIIRPKGEDNIGDYLALSVKKRTENSEVTHYIIDRIEGGFKFSHGSKCFDTLKEFVEYYSDRDNSLNFSLTYSVKMGKLVTRWEYGREAIVSVRRIGHGHFGEVFEGILNSRDSVALKTFRVETVDIIMREAEIARNIDHENVIRTIGVCRDPLYIITEFMPNGSLEAVLRRDEGINDAVRLQIAMKVARGMAYLASKGIVHRDLAARNILVGDTYDVIKIADFGLARQLIASEYYIVPAGREFPFKWTAPEALAYLRHNVTREGLVTKSADVWSYGVLLWEIYSKGAEPFSGIMFSIFESLVERRELLNHLNRPEGCPEKIHQLILRCCNYERKLRPTFEAIGDFLREIEQDAHIEMVQAAGIPNQPILPSRRSQVHRKRRNYPPKRISKIRFRCRKTSNYRYVVRPQPIEVPVQGMDNGYGRIAYAR